MDQKERLLDLLQRACDAEQALAASLSEAERCAAGAADKWTARDVLAHLAFWKEHLAQSIAAALKGLPAPGIEDYESANRQTFEAHCADAWEQVCAWLERGSANLLETTRALGPEQLADTQLLTWQNDRPLWRLIVGNGYIHPVSHLAQVHTGRGQVQEATNLQEGAARLLRELDKTHGWRGGLSYNLACHYALIGQKEAAIRLLGKALQDAPDLRDWSRQDTDLESIREEPAYRELVGG